jgi:uncharacterized protein YraI
MKRIVSTVVCIAMGAPLAIAAPAQITADVNFRTGPGTSNSIIQTIPESSDVDLLDCNESGSWCAVQFQGKTGFVSGQYLVQTEAEDTARWPRSFALDGDSFIVLYEPQISAWEDFRTIEALVAAEYRESEEAEPIFGVIGLRGDSVLNSDDGTVIVSDMKVTQIDFSALDRTQISKLSVDVGQLMPTEPLVLAEERVLVGLASFQQVADVEGLKADPPVIYVSDAAGLLLQTDGPALFAPVQGAPGVEFVINTNWDLFRVNDTFWLRDETSWLTSPALDGDWSAATTLPAELLALPDDGNWTDAREALEPVAYAEGTPAIYYSDTPAELVLFDGPPVFEAVPNGDLEWASNSEADIFRLKTSGVYYYLASGRWFSAPSLDGPWSFATPDLPVDFQNIPDDVPYYTVRASVPGTSEANEARLRAAIPELARVNLSEIVAPTVSYDGDPVFEPIEGTDLTYAVNTESQVIKVQDRYFLVADGIWFVSDSPTGPWSPATDIPDPIYSIPPSSPAYNVTYVRVYGYDNGYATYGYTSGYRYGYIAWGALVYGTGWLYRNYWNDHVHHPIYYPRPVTYGGANYYNPARGTFGRYGYAYGPYRGIAARSVWNPATGAYARGAKAYGPYGSRGFVYAVNPRTGTGAFARGGESIYGKWGTTAVRRGSEYLRVSGVDPALGGKGVRWDSSRGSGFGISDRRGNTYAGRNGNVYRKTGDSWQKWDSDSGWQGVQPPVRAELHGGMGGGVASARDRVKADPGTIGQNLPKATQGQTLKDKAANRAPQANRAPSNLGNAAATRARANQRSHQKRNVQAAPAQRPAARQGRPRSNAVPQRQHRSPSANGFLPTRR